jgi:HD-like signal output (HDOD) protein
MSTRTAGAPPNPFLERCIREMRAEQLSLPTLPDIAQKIRAAINSEDANSAKVARVVQMDPAITARLVHVANSALYAGRKKIESCPEALTRLGLKSAQHLITSLSLKTVFAAKTAGIRKRMAELWAHSSYVAAISAVLAHKSRGFDPDRAMLAGLIHDIGCVPVLAIADRHPEQAPDPAQLDQALRALRAPVGVLIMRRWDFPADFQRVAAYAEDWSRDHPGPADYTDLVLLAQLHSFVGTLQIHKYPRMNEIPAYGKLLGQGAADLSLDILDLAKEEIKQIQQILAA